MDLKSHCISFCLLFSCTYIYIFLISTVMTYLILHLLTLDTVLIMFQNYAQNATVTYFYGLYLTFGTTLTIPQHIWRDKNAVRLTFILIDDFINFYFAAKILRPQGSQFVSKWMGSQMFVINYFSIKFCMVIWWRRTWDMSRLCQSSLVSYCTWFHKNYIHRR